MRADRRGPKATAWSYVAGEKGRNRVRVFERADRPGIWCDWFDENGQRHRESLGTLDRAEAKAKADEIAAQFRREAKRRPHELQLGEAVCQYVREVTPTKGEATQRHDRRTFPMFVELFGARRQLSTLNRRDWDAFIAARRSGRLMPAGVKVRDGERHTVGDRAIEHDLALLNALLNWCVQAGDGRGHYLLERNPLKGLTAPAEVAPRRPVLSAAQYQGVREAAAALGPRIECLVVLAWETGHRGKAVRQLRWSDVDLERERVHWRGELDKIGLDHWNPLSTAAVAVLKRERKSEPRIGDGWIFPSPRKASEPLPARTLAALWKKLAAVAEVPTGERYGWHSLRRAFANRYRRAALKDLQDLGGWKSAHTVLTVYLQTDEDAQRAVLQGEVATEAPGLASAQS